MGQAGIVQKQESQKPANQRAGVKPAPCYKSRSGSRPKITKIHLGPSITDHCPHRENQSKKIQDWSGVEVILGTHPYKPGNIFV
jgi:hypothetical protein